ncbi:hypothetical protein RFI_18649, partial [Reticulomyxa filosa]
MDGEEWFYIDPFTEQPSTVAVTSYELKELFLTKRVTADCLVWNNSVGDDFVAISSLPELAEYLVSGNQVDASVQNVNMGKDSPENWREFFTEEGRAYYHNVITEEITWEKPDCLKTEEELGKAGDWQWIPHPHYGFAKAKFITTRKNGALAFETEEIFDYLFFFYWTLKKNEIVHKNISNKKKKEILISKGTVTYRVLWAILSRSTADLVMLDVLEPPVILHNLEKRFRTDEIYTKIGDILVAVNPYKRLPLYLPSVLDQYKEQDTKHLPPHVFEIAKNAFKKLLETSVSQSIIIRFTFSHFFFFLRRASDVERKGEKKKERREKLGYVLTIQI